MDPLTAFGLASNIVQFVDFSLKVISGAEDLYHNASGATAAHLEAKEVAHQIRRLSSLAAPPITPLAKPDSDLIPLSNDCGKIANELISLIDSVQVTETGPRRIWQSVYKAGQRQWKQKEIESLQNRLDRVGNLVGRFLVIHKQDQMLADLEQIKEDMTSIKSDKRSDMDRLLEQLNGIFNAVGEEIQRTGGETTLLPGTLLKMHATLPAVMSGWLDVHTDHSILKQLRYYEVDDRVNEISNPYPKTYEWIFDRSEATPDTSFASWLGSNDTMYWISGKPGSGKSTVMKYVSEHKRTIELLRPWANGCEVVIAKFFFWNPAKERLQKSKAGLLRSLLYQLLSKSSSQIRVVLSEAWDLIRTGEKNGQAFMNALLKDSNRLQSSLRKAMGCFQENRWKMLFFIDGLDEYEDKPSDIISLVHDLNVCSGPCLKLCLSSRPWIEFEDAAFGRDNRWKLEFHSRTENDIRKYVEELLGRNPLYSDLVKHDHRCPDLIRRIVEAAKGIFLWVKLVVGSLLEGLTHSDRVVDLLRRLHEIPTDLNEYFARILDSVDDRYHRDSARFFLIALESMTQLPLMIYWHIHESDTATSAISHIFDEANEHDVTVEFVDRETSAFRLEQMRRRLVSRCKQLLQISVPSVDLMKHSYYGGQVDFLHRTVRDFLQKPNVRMRLVGWAGSDFDADEAICRGITTQIRLTPLFENSTTEERWPPRLIDGLLWHAGHLQAKGTSGDLAIKHATEFFKLLKAHARRHRIPVEVYFQGVDTSHSDPADPMVPFDRGTVAARLRLPNLHFPDFELARLSVSHGRSHPAWVRRPSLVTQDSVEMVGEDSHERSKERKKPNDISTSMRSKGSPQLNWKVALKKLCCGGETSIT